jgi:hypothetical protein
MRNYEHDLACFKVTQALTRDGYIPKANSVEHSLARGEALAKLSRALATEQRVAQVAWGTPRYKAARTRVINSFLKLATILGRPASLHYPELSTYPEIVLDAFYTFQIPKYEN